MSQETSIDPNSHWEKIVYDDRSHHLELIDKRLKDLHHTDVQIRIGERTFACHMLLLRCFSEVFEEMDKVPAVTLPTEKVTPEAFELIYQWLLSASPRLQRKYFVAVFVAAEFLRIPELTNQCWACVDDAFALIEDRAFELYLEATAFQHTILQNIMLKRISKYFLPLVASGDLQQLPFEDVITLLSSNNIGVFSEADVLHSACLWLLEDWDCRGDHVGELMSLVRFPLMSSPLLSCLISCDEDERIHCILQHDTTKKLAIQALTDLCRTSSELGTGITSRSVHKVVSATNRNWLLEPNEISGCSPHRQERSFSEFLKLLERLTENPNSWMEWRSS
ncbi:actin-binding protein IPP-like [Wyeomyia smithii]|uniref:actin-binding protein IPP-like n=1 Tax=Wyeomyia smithii TaxID=174621 RepID=UPI002467BB9B|nr:actin-binding protein IPP-like [Wyeomyia smithii]